MPQGRQTLYQRDGLSAQLSYYGPGARMAPHAHDFHQLSWLLAGEFRERHHRDEQDIYRPSVGWKRAGFSHANEYGPHGALILSINASPLAQIGGHHTPSNNHSWAPTQGETAKTRCALIRLITAQDDLSRIAIDDLMALTPSAGTDPRPPAVRWLERAREQLRDETDAPDLDRLAREAGVHRVHLSRSFAQHYGVPPSLYRSRCRLAHAFSALLSGAPLADAAAQAGLADQAHLSRLARREIGLAPSRIRRLLVAS
jgi:AraC family transcriptional regulator